MPRAVYEPPTPVSPLALTFGEVAALIGVSPRQVAYLAAANELRTIRIRRSVRVLRSEVERYLYELAAEQSVSSRRRRVAS